MKTPRGVLETCLYVDDLVAARRFYVAVLGAQPFLDEPSRHLFLRIGDSLVFLFKPEASAEPTAKGGGMPIPTHGAHGPGHVAFEVTDALDGWREHLGRQGIAIEEEIHWPNGARSLYFRDPSGNSLELATSGLWREQLATRPDENPTA